MNTWQKLLLVVAALGSAVTLADVVNPCAEIDDPTFSLGRSLTKAFTKMQPCLKDTVTDEQVNQLKVQEPNLEIFQNFFKDFCPHAQKVSSCLAGVRESVSHCENKNVTFTFETITDMVEHMLNSGCDEEGSKLAYLARGTFLLIKRRETLVPLRRCLSKGVAFVKLADEANMDLTSETYNLYQEVAKQVKCMKHIEDDAYKQVFQWLLEIISQHMLCKHPTEERMVTCKTLSETEVPVHDICKVEALNKDHLFDHLQNLAAVGCYKNAFSLDLVEGNSVSDPEWLQAQYKAMCKEHRELPSCLLRVSAYSERCLTTEENKQFQLIVQTMEDAMLRNCVEDGARLSAVMKEVYKNTPEHGHAIRDCYASVKEASKGHEGHAVSTKNMRFYHETDSYRRCVVEKLHATNELAMNVESAFNDVMKKMKCVNPEDGSVVLCETIHEHH